MVKFVRITNKSKRIDPEPKVQCLEADCGDIILEEDMRAHVFAKHMTEEAIDELREVMKEVDSGNLNQ